MGFRGPKPKPDEARQRRNKPRTVVLSIRTSVPAPPAGLLEVTKERWGVYWKSPMSRAVQDAHIPVVERLFLRYDERARAYRAVRKSGRLAIGTKGQPIAHP